MKNHLVTLCSSKAAWPSVIFAILMAITLAAIAFSDMISKNKSWIFSIVLVLGLIWTLIIYWFCTLGYHAIGWFLLLLPLTFYLLWKLSYLIASVTTNHDCIIGGEDLPFIFLNGSGK